MGQITGSTQIQPFEGADDLVVINVSGARCCRSPATRADDSGTAERFLTRPHSPLSCSLGLRLMTVRPEQSGTSTGRST